MVPSQTARDEPQRVALLVTHGNDALVLSPFFGKCDGVLVVGPDTGSREFHPNTRHVPDAVCDIVLETAVRELIVGFADKAAAEKLGANGIDIRLGSCIDPIDGLAVNFANLPKA